MPGPLITGGRAFFTGLSQPASKGTTCPNPSGNIGTSCKTPVLKDQCGNLSLSMAQVGSDVFGGSLAMKSVLAFSVVVIALAGVASAVADDTQVTPDELFKRLDTNGDGKLTASEIPAEHRKFFERLLRLGDADKNGELTREEFDHAFSKPNSRSPTSTRSEVSVPVPKVPASSMPSASFSRSTRIRMAS